MRIALTIKENIYNFMRRAGYHAEAEGKKTAELSFVRRIGAAGYPRFHAYVSPRTFCGLRSAQDNEVVHKRCGVSRETSVINLHLDQKKPIYKGTTAHNGEYEGELVEKEAERIRQIADSR